MRRTQRFQYKCQVCNSDWSRPAAYRYLAFPGQIALFKMFELMHEQSPYGATIVLPFEKEDQPGALQISLAAPTPRD